MPGKIGILACEQIGDVSLATCVLKHKDKLWPGKEIVWFGHLAPHKAVYYDVLKYNDAIFEIRDWPKFKTMEDFRACIDPNGQLVMSRRDDFEEFKDLDNGYFGVPWAVLPNNALNSVNYANICRLVYGADPSWPWHPYLGYIPEEYEMAKEFVSKLPHKKTVILETELRSAGMFQLPDDAVEGVKAACRAKWSVCNFIFASKIDHTKYVDDEGVVSCAHFTPRQTGLIHDYCDLSIGVCSGLTQIWSGWGRKPVPRVELCGTIIQSNVVANGPVRSVICDTLSREQMAPALKNGVEESLQAWF